MNECIGVCSICGGQVLAHTVVWMSILPPPPPKCSGCGAVPRSSVVDMVPAPGHMQQPQVGWGTTSNKVCK